ncbi:response regulator [Candidatus Leptofilum sp.]|uniref:response regulator n=1 Tax=Candidatus Leptofilum sp. TaxID=3241576 RepID=UPI003B598840
MIETMTPQPPDQFVEDVKVALEHLYDFAFLQNLALAQQLASSKKRPSQTLGHHLRRELIEAIEALSPEPGAAAHAPDMRQYNLLQLHYVEGLTVQDVGQRLGLSTRQTHRSLRKAEASVATILWTRVQSATAVSQSPESAAQLSSVQAEFAQLETTLQPTDLGQLLQEAQKAVAPLAQAREVTFQREEPWPRLVVSVDTAVSRQLLLSVLSRLIQTTREQIITIRGTLGEEMAQLSLSFPTAEPLAHNFASDSVIAPLAEKLGWKMVVEGGNGRYQLQIQIPLHGPVVLVVDDNQGLVELLERYLTGHNCRVIAANSGEEGLAVLNRTTPDAIILDAMMPDVSGWDVLQTIRTRVETAETPVILCSVFNDPELAYALGASHFISKPVSRDQILTALRQLKVV